MDFEPETNIVSPRTDTAALVYYYCNAFEIDVVGGRSQMSLVTGGPANLAVRPVSPR